MANNDRKSILMGFLADDPTDLFSRYALALELIKETQYPQAIEQLEFVLKQDKNYLAAYYQLGKLYENKHPERAVEVYKTGMAIAQQIHNRHTYNELQGALNMLLDNEDEAD